MLQGMQEIDVRAVSDAISERILKLVSSGALKPGDALPPQRELAHQLGVSMSSLRESLHALSAIGVVEVKHGRGTFVSKHPTDSLIKQLDWSMLLQGDDTRELMEARSVVDVALARFAAQRATPAQVARLSDLYSGMFASWKAGDLQRLREQDIAFHLAVAEAACNSLVQRLASSVYDVAEHFMRVIPHTQTGMQNHRRVLDAIVAHDAVKAEAAMRLLLEETERLYQKRTERRGHRDNPPEGPAALGSTTA